MSEEQDDPTLLADLQEVLRIFVESDLRELSLDYGGISLRVSKNGALPPAPARAAAAQGAQGAHVVDARSVDVPQAGPAAPAAPVQQAQSSGPAAGVSSPGSGGDLHVGGTGAPALTGSAPDAGTPEEWLVRSPSAGYFHRRPSPSEPPFVEVGDKIDEGAPVCIIEVMKMFTEIRAARSGVVKEIRLDNGSLVEQGDILMVLAPGPGSE